jgi:hypothetical protein
MKNHNLSKFLVCAVLLAAVGLFDYLTGYEISSYPIYLMPIFLSFFYFGKKGGYLVCVLSIVMWTFIDIINGHVFSHEIVRYWAAGSRLAIYLMFVYGLSVYVKTVAVHRQRLEGLRRLISMCHGCGRVHWKDGTWKTPEEALELSDTEVPECPECSAIRKESVGA